jgi:hypothetical protein
MPCVSTVSRTDKISNYQSNNNRYLDFDLRIIFFDDNDIFDISHRLISHSNKIRYLVENARVPNRTFSRELNAHFLV